MPDSHDDSPGTHSSSKDLPQAAHEEPGSQSDLDLQAAHEQLGSQSNDYAVQHPWQYLGIWRNDTAPPWWSAYVLLRGGLHHREEIGHPASRRACMVPFFPHWSEEAEAFRAQSESEAWAAEIAAAPLPRTPLTAAPSESAPLATDIAEALQAEQPVPPETYSPLHYTTARDHPSEVIPQLNHWREHYEYHLQNLNKDFKDDCIGSRVLDQADPQTTILIWLCRWGTLGPMHAHRMGFIGAILQPGGRHGARCQIERIYIPPHHRGAGLSRLLISALLHEASARQVPQLNLGSGLRHQASTRRFWPRLGFTPDAYKNISDTTVPMSDALKAHSFPPPPWADPSQILLLPPDDAANTPPRPS